MAHSRYNVITRTYSGKLGHVVLQADGVIRSRPDMSNRVLSEKQQKHLARFELAKKYGRMVRADAELSALYSVLLKPWKKKKKNIGIYQLAIKDFMNPPEISKIEVVVNPDGTGMIVRIKANDIIKLAGVSVSIILPGGMIAEKGEATWNIRAEYNYNYIFEDLSLWKQGTILVVSAWDLPGNVAQKEFPFNC